MKKIISVISVIIVFIIIPILFLYYCGSQEYLDTFFAEQMIPLMGTIMALNFATASSLQAILFSIEDKKDMNIFAATKSEIRQNLIFMIVVFLLAFILQVIKNPASKMLLYPLISIKLLVFFMYFYAIYDLNKALFCIAKKD